MEKVEYRLGGKYAYAVQSLWLSLFYGYSLPYLSLITGVCLIGFYLIDKYNLLRNRTVKESLGKLLTSNMVGLAEVAILLFAFGLNFFTYLIFDKYLSGSIRIPPPSSGRCPRPSSCSNKAE